jgi:hypothetical protein
LFRVLAKNPDDFASAEVRPDKELTVGDPVEGFSLSRKLFLWIVPERKDK